MYAGARATEWLRPPALCFITNRVLTLKLAERKSQARRQRSPLNPYRLRSEEFIRQPLPAETERSTPPLSLPPGRRRRGYGGCPVVLRYCSHGDRSPWEQYRSSAGAVPSLPAGGPRVAGDYRTLEGRLAGTARNHHCPKCGHSAGCQSGGTPGSGRRGIMTLRNAST